MQRDLFHFRAVPVPYGVAREILRDDPARLFATPFKIGARHPDEMALEADVGGILVGAEVTVEIGTYDDVDDPLPLARRAFSWHAVDHPGLFPVLHGELEAYPLTARDTQVTFTCHYRPPLRGMGAVVDSIYLHKVAETCLARFFEGVVDSLGEAWEVDEVHRATPESSAQK